MKYRLGSIVTDHDDDAEKTELGIGYIAAIDEEWVEIYWVRHEYEELNNDIEPWRRKQFESGELNIEIRNF